MVWEKQLSHFHNWALPLSVSFDFDTPSTQCESPGLGLCAAAAYSEGGL